jgi:hypothetical protein
MKKQLYDVAMQIHMMDQISARQKQAIMALLKLQAYGITDEEILNVHGYLNRARFESGATIRR